MKEAKVITFASFGNRDILPQIYRYLRENSKNMEEVSKTVKNYLLDKYFKVLTKVKTSKVALAARREWLLSNSRCSEVLDSEFYYQMLPSLDMAVFEVDQRFLKERQIKAIETMKPDSRYVNMVSIGFNLP